MRMARIRYDREMCYYHLMNRVAGEPGYYPFGDVEKEKLFGLAAGLARFYALDLLSGAAGTGFIWQFPLDCRAVLG